MEPNAKAFREAIDRDLDTVARWLRVSLALNFVSLLLGVGAIYLALLAKP